MSTSVQAISVAATLQYENVNLQNPKENHLLITLDGRARVEGEERKPICLSAALDLSGSMSGNKIKMLKESLRVLVKNLSDRDHVGLIGYSETAWEIAPITRCDSSGKELLNAEIDKLEALSSTNISGGALRSIEQVQKADVGAKDVQRVLLLTDGMPNVGVVDRESLTSFLGQRCLQPIDMSTFGYSDGREGGYGSYDPEVLASIANACRGNYHHIDGPDCVPAALGNEIGGLMSVVGQNVKITLRLNKGVEVLDVLNDYDVTHDADSTNGITAQHVFVNDVFAEEKKQVVLKLKLPSFTNATAGARPKKNIATIVVSYVDTTTGQDVVVEQKIDVNFVKPGKENTNGNPEVEKYVAIVSAGNAQREALKRAKYGDYDSANALLREARERIKGCEFFESDKQLQAAFGAVEEGSGISSMLASCEYDAEIASSAYGATTSMIRGRTSGNDAYSHEVGTTSTRAMAMKFSAEIKTPQATKAQTLSFATGFIGNAGLGKDEPDEVPSKVEKEPKAGSSSGYKKTATRR